MKPRYNTYVNAIFSAKTIHVGLGSPVFLFLFEVFLKVVILCGCIPKPSLCRRCKNCAVLVGACARMHACLQYTMHMICGASGITIISNVVH